MPIVMRISPAPKINMTTPTRSKIPWKNGITQSPLLDAVRTIAPPSRTKNDRLSHNFPLKNGSVIYKKVSPGALASPSREGVARRVVVLAGGTIGLDRCILPDPFRWPPDLQNTFQEIRLQASSSCSISAATNHRRSNQARDSSPRGCSTSHWRSLASGSRYAPSRFSVPPISSGATN